MLIIFYLFPFPELHCCSKVDDLYCLAIFFGQNNVFRLTNIRFKDEIKVLLIQAYLQVKVYNRLPV